MSHARLSIIVRRLRAAAPPLWLVVVLPLSFYAAAALSLSVFGENTPIWVSSGFAVTALLRNKKSTWPVLIGLTAVADYAGNLVASGPLVGLGIVTFDCVEILLVAMLAGFACVASPIDGIRSMARLAMACLLAPVLTSAVGAALLTLAYGPPFLAGWKTWYLADMCGLLTVTPLLLSWTDQALRKTLSYNDLVQTAILAGLVALVGYLDFHDMMPGLFLVFPILLVATFNGRLLGATTAAAALAVVAIWSTAAGHGPIAALAHTSAHAKVQTLQLYIVVILLSSLPVAAILEQREKLTAQLRETTRVAQSALRAKSEFLAVISHEIRTPMTAVLGMADLLMNAGLPSREHGYVTGIRASGRHLLALINDVLDFSRAEAGKIDLEIIDFNIRELLEQVRSLLAPQAIERGLDLCFEVDPQSPPALRGDPTRLKQVLVNLVGNGLKFTQRGGVTVTVGRRPVKDSPDRFRFEVRDSGIGISEEKRPILFNAFSQVDLSTTRQYGGSGLGLAICKKLVEAMGGDIGVESVSGIGSRFWFEVPLQLGVSPTVQATAPRQPASSSSRRVLLVEDVELNQVLISDMLRSHGHEVTLAVNGMEAVAMAGRDYFDIVLMDIQMPVMDGIEATRRIRGLPLPAGQVPVLALTANVMMADREQYLAAGMNGALTKPIDWPQLFEALARYGDPDKSVAEPVAAAKPGADTEAVQSGVTVAYATPADTDGPIDTAVLDRICGLQGEAGDVAGKLAEIFIRDVGARLEDLRDAAERADAPAVARMAHAIRGSAANLGARFMVKICTGIESRADFADVDATLLHVDELHREFARARVVLTAKAAAS